MQQHCTQAMALVRRVDTYERQIPMRFFRMAAVHLHDHGGNIRSLLRCYAFFNQFRHCLAIGTLVRCQPQGHGGIVLAHEGRPSRQCSAPQRADELREMPEVPIRFREQPPIGRVRGKC
jgi:hypothetical protein